MPRCERLEDGLLGRGPESKENERILTDVSVNTQPALRPVSGSEEKVYTGIVSS
jgi:hypothetical protein